ncbi:unnamed protein product [Gongylonema pulchrum]|uniref:Xis n=1 Tax=Gongylonema pulchrum TaxID=637853 RepID=A0A183EZ06_9BILA|nr:unnamed protein product [Gongylonema pulchrum]
MPECMPFDRATARPRGPVHGVLLASGWAAVTLCIRRDAILLLLYRQGSLLATYRLRCDACEVRAVARLVTLSAPGSLLLCG